MQTPASNSALIVGPYVNFQGRAREAMELYHSLLGGSLELHSSNEQGEPRPAGPEDPIIHARLQADGLTIIGSDGHPKFAPTVGDNWAIFLEGTDRERLTKIFDGLAEGGQVRARLIDQPWGASGWLTDRFGVNWTVNISKA